MILYVKLAPSQIDQLVKILGQILVISLLQSYWKHQHINARLIESKRGNKQTSEQMTDSNSPAASPVKPSLPQRQLGGGGGVPTALVPVSAILDACPFRRLSCLVPACPRASRPAKERMQSLYCTAKRDDKGTGKNSLHVIHLIPDHLPVIRQTHLQTVRPVDWVRVLVRNMLLGYQPL